MRITGRARTGTTAVAALALVLGGPAVGAAAVATTATEAVASEQLDVNVGGWAENLLPLADGDVLVSNLVQGLVQRIDGRTHEVTTVAEVAGPGGLAVDGDTLYVVTGNTPLSAVTGEGGVLALDLATGERRTVVSGMGEANGLGRLPGGDLVYTVTLGPGTGVHRVDPDTGEDRLLITAIPGPNGLSVGPEGQAYVGSTMMGTITRVDPETGEDTRVAGVSALVDDFDVLPDGRIVAATVLGFVDVLDPTSGDSRPLDAGHLGATSARVAANGRVIVSTVSGRVVSLDLVI